VRRRNCGIDGKPILFYAARSGLTPTPHHRGKTKLPKSEQYGDVVDALKALGLASMTTGQMAELVKQLFPAGTSNTDQSEVVRAVFVHLKRQNPTDNIG